MKKYNIRFVIYDDMIIEADDDREAEQKFKEECVDPKSRDTKIIDIQEWVEE